MKKILIIIWSLATLLSNNAYTMKRHHKIELNMLEEDYQRFKDTQKATNKTLKDLAKYTTRSEKNYELMLEKYHQTNQILEPCSYEIPQDILQEKTKKLQQAEEALLFSIQSKQETLNQARNLVALEHKERSKKIHMIQNKAHEMSLCYVKSNKKKLIILDNLSLYEEIQNQATQLVQKEKEKESYLSKFIREIDNFTRDYFFRKQKTKTIIKAVEKEFEKNKQIRKRPHQYSTQRQSFM